MTTLILVMAGAALLFLIGEHARRRFHLSNEFSRKLVHILHGGVIATVPFLVGYTWVYIFEIALLILIVLCKQFKMLSWMWKVGRLSWGEFAYPIGIMLAAYLAESEWIFATGVLVLALADATAALVGKTYGKSSTYIVNGQKKSVVGSIAFYVVAVCVITLTLTLGLDFDSATALMAALGVGLLLTCVENLATYGTDNLILPTLAVIALNVVNW